MKTKLTAVFAIVFLGLGGHARAESLIDGSIEEGQSKAVTCAACHGADGNSVNPEWPNLAGQSASYIVAQLQAFKDDKRRNPLMTSQAMLLSDTEMRDLAVYYENLPGAAQAVADASMVDKGEALYRGGDAESGAAACLACHGPTGRGNPAAGYPALNGQHATYTAKQLRDYASGERRSSNKVNMMREIAQRLSTEDIDALASYVQGLR